MVEGWQGLEMEASGVDAQGNSIDRLEPLRIDRLNPETMLCIFNGKVKKIEVKQPPEGMHFGASPAGKNTYQKLHLRDEAGDQIKDTKCNVPMRDSEIARVVDIKALANKMAEQLTGNNDKFTSAEFGVQMVESPGRVTFSDKTFTGDDITNLSSLADRLKNRDDGVSKFLWGRFSEGVQERLSTFVSPDQEHHTQLDAMNKALNNIIEGEELIYEEERFTDVALSDETKELLEKKPRGEVLVHLNRLLLEDAYPDTIPKSKGPDFTFLVEDSEDLESFAERLKHPSDSLSYFLLSRLRGEAPQLFSSLEEDLAMELNSIIRGDSIYEVERFAGVALSDETKELLKKKPRGEELVRLNRLLLEDAYPDEIARRPN